MNDPNNNQTLEFNKNSDNHKIFHEKFYELFQNGSIKDLKNVWILNEITIPIKTTEIKKKNGTARSYSKCSLSQNDINSYPNELNYMGGKEFNSTFEMPDAEIMHSSRSQKKNVATFYACNYQGSRSLPFIVFPKNEFKDDLTMHPIKQATCIEECLNGDSNVLSIFFRWLKLFLQQQRLKQHNLNENIQHDPTILLLNLFSLKILKSSSEIYLNEFNHFCKSENVFILFYPIVNKIDVFNHSLSVKFKEQWNKCLEKVSIMRDPNTQFSFVIIYNQVLRIIFQNLSIVKECFEELFRSYPIKIDGSNCFEMCDSKFNVGKLEKVKLKSVCLEPKLIDEEKEVKEHNSNLLNEKLEDDLESNELIECVDALSKIGSLCIKQTILQELSIKKSTHQQQNSMTNKLFKQILSSEKYWNEFIRKNHDHFKHRNSFGLLSESDYLTKWFDVDFWLSSYYDFVKIECNLKSSQALWSFDILQFPIKKNIVKEPQRNYNIQHNNSKTQISVIFAYNASGDNLEPSYVYPLSFASDSYDIKREMFTQNGDVTSQVFNTWLSNSFIPHIQALNNNKQTNVILYPGKLAIIDTKVLKFGNSNNVKFFALTHENLIPSNIIFKKVMRNRHIDLFRDSWHKSLENFGLSLNFKFSSTRDFFNLFLDVFQNCIEEIGNESFDQNVTYNNANKSIVSNFEKKIIDSFETCKLWPLN